MVRRFFGNGEGPVDFAPVLQRQHLRGVTGSERTNTGGFAVSLEFRRHEQIVSAYDLYDK